jgi:hypothetical protein
MTLCQTCSSFTDMEIEGWDDWAVEGSLLRVLPSSEDILRTYIKREKKAHGMKNKDT